MDAHPPALEPEAHPVEGDPNVTGTAGTAPAFPPRPEHAREIIPWITEITFVTGVLLVGLIVFLVLTSGQDPFATALIPIILVVAVVAAVMRHRWIRRHAADAEIVNSRRAARERRGF